MDVLCYIGYNLFMIELTSILNMMYGVSPVDSSYLVKTF
jgi:hypothetical protein